MEWGGGHGLVTANGMYLTKHSLGLYSTEAPAQAWQDAGGSALQAQIDGAPRVSVAMDPSGRLAVSM